jgi:hypothetical protein
MKVFLGLKSCHILINLSELCIKISSITFWVSTFAIEHSQKIAITWFFASHLDVHDCRAWSTILEIGIFELDEALGAAIFDICEWRAVML